MLLPMYSWTTQRDTVECSIASLTKLLLNARGPIPLTLHTFIIYVNAMGQNALIPSAEGLIR